MNNFEKFIEKATNKGKSIIITLGDTMVDSKELLCKKKQLEKLIYNLGVDVFEEYSQKTTSVVRKRFSETFDMIEKLDKETTLLEEELAKAVGKKFCPDCNSVINLEARFCPECGKEQEFETEEEIIEEEFICPNCGEEYAEDQNFCSKCGEKLI